MKYLIKKLLWKLNILKRENPVDYALKVVEATKPEEWTTGEIMNFCGECCFLGHLGKSLGKAKPGSTTNTMLDIPEIKEIDKKIVSYVEEKYDRNIEHSFMINDYSTVNGYNEKHPRERMLHVLRDMKADGWDKK